MSASTSGVDQATKARLDRIIAAASASNHTAQDVVLAAMREAILTAALPPGMRLRQEVARSLRWPTLQHAPEHHEAFFEAIRAGDAERAASQLGSHYHRVAILIRRYLRDASTSERQRPPAIRDIDLERATRTRAPRRRRSTTHATG